MAESIARTLLVMLAAYATLGLVFGVAFAARGASRVNPSAHGATRGFKLVIVPGVAALWPYLLHRWLRADGGSS